MDAPLNLEQLRTQAKELARDRRAVGAHPPSCRRRSSSSPAAQAGRAEAVEALLDLGADPEIPDALHGGTAGGWAEFGGHPELARRLRKRR
jgi:hypothetical protein